MKYINNININLIWQTLRLLANRIDGQTYTRKMIAPLNIHYENIGSEPINPKHSYIMVCNHRSTYDIPLCHYTLFSNGLPYIFGIAKNKFLLPTIMRKMTSKDGKTILEAGSDNLAAWTFDHLSKGGNMLIYPESTRNRTTEPLLPFKAGVDVFVRKSKHDLLLCYIDHSEAIIADGRTDITIKYKAFTPEDRRHIKIEPLYRELFSKELES